MIDYDAQRWWVYLFQWRGSVLKRILGRLSLLGLWAGIVVLIQQCLVEVDIPDKGHTMVAVALGLLLVIRTNASYDRYWEGRRLWGTVINEARGLIRLGTTLLSAAPDLQTRLRAWTSCFAHAMMGSLRGEKVLGPATHALADHECSAVLEAGHVPLAISAKIGAVLAEARQRGVIGEVERMHLERFVQAFLDCLGGCERIRNTPLPYAYAVHLRWALLLYGLTLPLALVHSFGWVTVPATFGLMFILLGVEEIGLEIEDPFGRDDNDLPLERYCATIERDTNALIPSRDQCEAA